MVVGDEVWVEAVGKGIVVGLQEGVRVTVLLEESGFEVEFQWKYVQCYYA